MSETINWSVNFAVVLGPKAAASGSQTTDAYDKMSIQLAAAATDVDVDVQPSAAAGDVQLLIIMASSYKADVSFSADAGTTSFVLDGPLVLIGAGPVSLLADPPQTLRFANPSADPVDVNILVGRQA
ncbi:hypothetical protein ACI8AA_01510 [Geodermatophilus sp. SYSU D01180]